VVAPAAPPASARAETVIRPSGKWGILGARELWGARELLYFMAKREIQIRYKQSFFGVAWAVLQPLAYAFIFALFFGKLAKVPSDGVPYPVFALAALSPWVFESQSVAQAATSVVADANVLTKVYFPRLVVPLARIVSFMVDLVIALVILVIFVFIYGAHPTAGLALLPLFITIAVVTAVGVGTLLAALNVQYRDVTLVIPLITQLWLLVSPVAYPSSLIHGFWRYVYAINPMATVIDGSRWAFTGTAAPAPGVVAVSVGSALLLAVAGLAYFRRTERYFADVI
jgi:lipopolysaccharide transport system permease protein